MNGPIIEPRDARPVHLLTVGPFGRAVAEYLRSLRVDVCETSVDGGPGSIERGTDARITLVAAWRPVPDLCESLDRVSHESRRPFVPLIAESTVLRLGPIVVPGQGACWSCWMQRRRQHAEWPEELTAISQHYAGHERAGPEGYLEPFALVGAVQLAQAVAALDASAPVGGRLSEIDMLSRDVTTGTVAGVHDCPRCGLHRSPATRTVADMARCLEHLWPERPASIDEDEASQAHDAAMVSL